MMATTAASALPPIEPFGTIDASPLGCSRWVGLLSSSMAGLVSVSEPHVDDLPCGPTPASESTAEMKRLTIDISVELHTRLKTECAKSGKKIGDVVRDLITEHLKAS
jgi:hypothetical protein